MLRWKQSATQSRPEEQPTTRPEPDPVATLKLGLRELKERDGNPSYRELAARTDYSHTVLSQAVSGKGMPTWPVTSAFVTACGGDENEWRKRWLIANESARDKTQKIKTSHGSELKTVDGDSRLQFAIDLGRRLDKSNYSRRAIADRAGFAPSTLSAVLAGHRLPRPDLLSGVLAVVGASAGEIDQWLERRVRLGVAHQADRLMAANIGQNAPGTAPSRQGRMPQIFVYVAVASSLLATTVALISLPSDLDSAEPPSKPRSAAIAQMIAPSPTSAGVEAFTERKTYTYSAPRFTMQNDVERQGLVPLESDARVLIVCRVINGTLVAGPTDEDGATTVWARLPDDRYVPFNYLRVAGADVSFRDCERHRRLGLVAAPRTAGNGAMARVQVDDARDDVGDRGAHRVRVDPVQFGRAGLVSSTSTSSRFGSTSRDVPVKPVCPSVAGDESVPMDQGCRSTTPQPVVRWAAGAFRVHGWQAVGDIARGREGAGAARHPAHLIGDVVDHTS